MEKLKSDILEDVHKKNSDFISLIESNIKSDSKSPFAWNKNMMKILKELKIWKIMNLINIEVD